MRLVPLVAMKVVLNRTGLLLNSYRAFATMVAKFFRSPAIATLPFKCAETAELCVDFHHKITKRYRRSDKRKQELLRKLSTFTAIG